MRFQYFWLTALPFGQKPDMHIMFRIVFSHICQKLKRYVLNLNIGFLFHLSFSTTFKRFHIFKMTAGKSIFSLAM